MSEKMIFCLGEGKYIESGIGYQKSYHIFNKPVSKEVYNKTINSQPLFFLPICKWIDKKEMTDNEKELKTSWGQTGGYLKVLSYPDAWKECWANASQEFKKWVKDLPNFDVDIFKKITGLDIEESLIGTIATVEIGGKTYKAKIVE